MQVNLSYAVELVCQGGSGGTVCSERLLESTVFVSFIIRSVINSHKLINNQ